ncbi:M15 family metallopeptidase [Candidatus Dependentiae bacterium]|nr:M15 family metallopeptidase [Candidatus Dependentiae bacterium]
MDKGLCSKDFMYLSEVDPSIVVSLRYSTPENFIGRPVDGYRKPLAIVTRQVAEALKKAQKELNKDGYSLVVYDAYRPQQAVDCFMEWSENPHDQVKKLHYYPRVDKSRVFELGYVAKRSSHSRGSTVDITLIEYGKALHEILVEDRTLLDGFTIKYLNDGTVDMGSSFDLFDRVSHHINNLITHDHKNIRAYLRRIMEKQGFKTIEEEWWHYVLKEEPYSADHESSYFNYCVE